MACLQPLLASPIVRARPRTGEKAGREDLPVQDVTFGGIPTLSRVVRPLLGDIGKAAARLGFTWTDFRAGPTLRLFFEGRGDRFEVWIRPASVPGPALVRTRRFGVGYFGGRGSEPVVNMTLYVAAKVRKNEDRLTDDVYRRVFGGTDRPGPVVLGDVVELRPTLRCNESCPFCSTVIDEATVPDNVFADDTRATLLAIDQARERGISRLTISGGEPTLLKGLPELVAHAKGLGFNVTVQTNGLLAGRPGYFDRFGVLPDGLLLTIATSREDRLMTLSGRAGTLDTKVAAGREALRRGIALVVNHVVTAVSLDELAGFPDFLVSALQDPPRDRVSLVLSVVVPVGRAATNPWLLPRYGDVAAPMGAAVRRATELRLRVVLPLLCGVPPCVVPDVREFHEAFCQGDSASLVESVNGFVRLPACAGCAAVRVCPGVRPGYLDRYGDSEFVGIR